MKFKRILEELLLLQILLMDLVLKEIIFIQEILLILPHFLFMLLKI